jgi:polyribonucleotide nucleotidyltransferase
MSYICENALLGGREISIETGRMAKQASGSVVIRQGDTVVLVTCVGGGERPDLPFFPLVCDYVEKTYAGGHIPGNFFRREGRLGEHEILSSRLMDRPLRPLFPDGYRGDTQLAATVISHDKENASDVLAITGASTALMLSHLPWAGPIAGIRVGRVDGEFIANPTRTELEESDFNIIVACSEEAIVMVEGETSSVSEEEMLDAFDFAREVTKPLLELQHRLQKAVGKEKMEFVTPELDKAVVERVRAVSGEKLVAALKIKEKIARYSQLAQVKSDMKEQLAEEFPEQMKDVSNAFDKIKKGIMRSAIANEGIRIDGRDYSKVRSITTEVSMLPRPHGSALFTRGETQALVTCTLDTQKLEKRVESLMGNSWRRFMLDYNFPPFSVGEVRPLRGPGRREIGHGILARRAILPVLPEKEVFPYCIRLVSEVLESNGSSSMATVCGASMALMDAGVPISNPVAGIAMGLIEEDGKYIVLSDILGDEDHMGDMDFKVAGTREGITAIQMDTKIAGITRDVMLRALDQAKDGRMHILDEMGKSIESSREELSQYAPRIISFKIKPERIRDVIGPGGKNIRGIVEATGVDINVEDNGTVSIASADQDAADKAVNMVKAMTMEPDIGENYLGIVARVVDFGAFITILPGLDGLCHISELCDERVDKVTDILKEGDEVIVKCIGLERGKVKLSRRAALGEGATVTALATKR